MKSLAALKDLTSKLKQQVKQAVPATTCTTPWVKQGELEKEREQKYLEEQAKREEEKKRKQDEKMREIQEKYALKETPITKESQQIEEEKRKEIPKDEVISRLRHLKQPVTLFGESDEQRFNRLVECEAQSAKGMKKADKDETAKSFIPEDHEVELLKFMKQQEALIAEEAKKNNQMQDLNEEEDEENPAQTKTIQGASDQIDNYLGKYKSSDELKIGDRSLDQLIEIKEKNQQLFRNFRKFEAQCKRHPVEEKSRMVYIWCKKMLQSWEGELVFKDNEYLQSAQGKQELGMLKQCEKYCKPLFKLLKKKECNTEILDGLYLLVQYCLMKEYVRAHDKYLELAIGNAPWPMGVTMVGIHERSGRSRIFTSQVAHILNDETQRKYLQSIKRMLTVCQRIFPTDPSKCVKN